MLRLVQFGVPLNDGVNLMHLTHITFDVRPLCCIDKLWVLLGELAINTLFVEVFRIL